MQLNELAHFIGGKLCHAEGLDRHRPSGVSIDTRTLKHGEVFVAVPGERVSGASFIRSAFEKGASICVTSSAEDLQGLPGIVVSNVRVAVSKLAALFAGNPAQRMHTIGVTGTNGKTTTNWLIFHALNALGCPCVRSGTLGVATYQQELLPETLTTPDAITLHQVLAQALQSGCKAGVFEASSHALAQHRADDLRFDVGIFTNLTRDHLDYHQTMENYLAAKERLFELVEGSGKKVRTAIFNLDDPAGTTLAGRWRSRIHVTGFGRRPEADLCIAAFEQSVSGSQLELRTRQGPLTIRSKYIGEHNAENISAAVATLLALGFTTAEISEVFPGIPAVPGRLEPVPARSVGVFVDYAHTPDALVRAIEALRPLTKGRLHVLFGCGGDRDRGKRPQMLKAAIEGGDLVTVTSDNPRTEDPARIISDILAGNSAPALVEPDRRRAIEATIGRLSPGDVVLIAGKGHEQYQILGTTKHHFSDVEECQICIQNRGI